jgi:hypothetical protein
MNFGGIAMLSFVLCHNVDVGAFRVRFSECRRPELRWPMAIAAESSNTNRCLQ